MKNNKLFKNQHTCFEVFPNRFPRKVTYIIVVSKIFNSLKTHIPEKYCKRENIRSVLHLPHSSTILPNGFKTERVFTYVSTVTLTNLTKLELGDMV